ncbi:NADP-dependent oxidoreductase [Microbacterium sp. C7(2022)]|uniref:NADP-dependent oxidoreductase n=1 Tax=Microbacterium sp. C7(2022) TaxID=2992759 RepID=UPI00237BF12D|nr:NADP-dependent oxidoreductase [Microbacterium sp. C7(2022)]MDE0546645.1 NADP-dependent oxidoreductase [Microbacterium sp. C7(2022)]
MSAKTAQTAAFVYTRYGDADVLQRHESPLRSPGPSEVAVEVVTSGINHMEVFLRNGNEPSWQDDPWPRRSGSDFAGIVRACGPGVEAFRPGQDVIGHVRTGAHATHVVVDQAALVRKPKNVSWEMAGGMYLAGCTALDTLDELRIGSDDTVVISAAAGGVGSIEAQLAKHAGARVIGTCGERNFDYLRQLGIIPVKYGEGLAERIDRVAHGRVTAFIDNFGKDGSDTAERLGVPADRYRSSTDRRDVELRLLADDADSVAHGTSQLERLARLAEQRAFVLLISGLYALGDIVEAYEDLSRLHARGKIILATHPVSPYRVLKARDIHEAMA